MTRLALIPVPTVVSWRPLAPFAALFALLMLFAVGGMLVVAHEADRSDAARAREAVSRTFSGIVSRLDAAAEMNAATPEIASALSGSRATPLSAYGYLGFTHKDALGYYGSVVLNRDGSAFGGTRFGLPWTGSSLAATARLIAPIAKRLPAQGPGTVHAIVRDGLGHALAIAVVNVVPVVGTTLAEGDVEGLRRLALVSPVDFQFVPKMLPSLGVEDFRIVAASDLENAVTIPVELGQPIVFVWRSRMPGLAAVARWAPAMGILLLTALFMLAAAARANMRAMQALEHQAHHDFLTGLANRLAFREELDRRHARGDVVALGMVDLNGFKAVNDQYGHLVGDQLLQAVAIELALSASQSDFVARLGGDEFAWISTSLATAKRLNDDFAERLTRPLPVGQLHLLIGAAVGIALASRELTDSALMALADNRLYENKLDSRRQASPTSRLDTGSQAKCECDVSASRVSQANAIAGRLSTGDCI